MHITAVVTQQRVTLVANIHFPVVREAMATMGALADVVYCREGFEGPLEELMG